MTNGSKYNCPVCGDPVISISNKSPGAGIVYACRNSCFKGVHANYFERFSKERYQANRLIYGDNISLRYE